MFSPCETLYFQGDYHFDRSWIDIPTTQSFVLIVGQNNIGKTTYLAALNSLSLLPIRTLIQNNPGLTFKSKFICSDRSQLQQLIQELTGRGIAIVGIDFPCEFNLIYGRNTFNISFEGEVHPNIKHALNEGIEKLKTSLFDRFIFGDKVTTNVLLAERSLQLYKKPPVPKREYLNDNASNAIAHLYSVLSTAEFKDSSLMWRRSLIDSLNEIICPLDLFTDIVPIEIGENSEFRNGIKLNKDEPGFVDLYFQTKSGQQRTFRNFGSGIQTVLLILMLLNPIERLKNKDRLNNTTLLLVEEIESHLHPTAIRRLLSRIEHELDREDDRFKIIITSHSPTVIEYGMQVSASAIIHLYHGMEGEVCSTRLTSNVFHCNILDDLGVKASDLLQANGIIWVEGPSDRIYVNRWIELFSETPLREGKDYQILYYGGSVLTHYDGSLDNDYSDDLIKMFRINRNFIVLCDSDKCNEDSDLKPRVQRIMDSVDESEKRFVWVTECREIENYLPERLLRLESIINSRENKKFIDLFDKSRKKKLGDKVMAAKKFAMKIEKDDIELDIDLSDRIRKLVKTVMNWNV